MAIAKVISIGDELLIGQVINTNSSFICEKLFSINIPVNKIITIGDNENDILWELKDSVQNFDVTIITGGLGPTHDDITKCTLVKFFKDELILNENILEYVKNVFKNRGTEMPEVNKEQALVPKGSMIIWNPNGTAPGICFEQNSKIVISLPGVPFEMKTMMENSVIPLLREKMTGKIDLIIKSKTLLTTGVGESILSEKLGDINELTKGEKLAFLPSVNGVRLRIDVKGITDEEAIEKLKEIETNIRSRIGEYIYGVNNEILEKIVGDLLISQNMTISTAESCTAGLLGAKITSIPGSSKYFTGGIISYSNEIKSGILQVKSETLDTYGAVSEQTAIEMANNIRLFFKTDIGISITGIAGPDGGTEEKPVGLVYIGFSDKNKTFAKKFLFGDNRERNRERAVVASLNLVREELLSAQEKT